MLCLNSEVMALLSRAVAGMYVCSVYIESLTGQDILTSGRYSMSKGIVRQPCHAAHNTQTQRRTLLAAPHGLSLSSRRLMTG